MNKKIIEGLDLADYYGTVLENIDFESPIEVDPEEFSVRVKHFSFSNIEDEILTLQCDLEEGSFVEIDEIEEIVEQIMTILLENTDGELESQKEIREKLNNGLNTIFPR